MSSKHRRQVQAELSKLTDPSDARDQAMAQIGQQLRTAVRVTVIALVVIWLIAGALASGTESRIPLIVAGVLTVAAGIVAIVVRRNLSKSQELGELMGGSDLSPADKEARLEKLEARVAKGDAAAVLTKAQLQMQDDPRSALETLESADLEKANKAIANQIRATRGMIHLNHGEVKAARQLAEEIDLQKAPDPKSRANLGAVVAEAWARSGNPIEATELLDQFDLSDAQFQDVQVQLLRARAFAEAHRNKVPGMRKALKELTAISPQLLAVFVGQKRVHPILSKEARKMLEGSGLVPKMKIQGARR